MFIFLPYAIAVFCLLHYSFFSVIIKDRNLSYSERLNRLNITTLETRRLRGDLIQVSEIFKGLDNVQHSDFLHYGTYRAERS